MYSTFSREGEVALTRLAFMTRGLGDPLIAAYARMFVCRMGVDIAPSLTQYIVGNIEDFLHTLTQLEVRFISHISSLAITTSLR